jgi:pimeloyl-ACP methyl ester carboxylesterase
LNAALAPRPLRVERAGLALAGEVVGEGAPIVLVHGLTATRRYVVHGSRALPRAGFRTVSYDARGHGESDPAPPGSYTYSELARDLAALLEEVAPDRPCVLAGHSMGAHTIAALALAEPARVAGIVAIEPVYAGEESGPDALARWDSLADGLERGGVDGFIDAYDDGLDPDWRETLIRIARERLSLHRHPDAVARALREIPRSRPFGDLGALERLEIPALVVGSHDEADPSHPYAAALAWSERLPRARLVTEDPGSSPLAWQGGRLSREIAAFCATPEVAAELSARR